MVLSWKKIRFNLFKYKFTKPVIEINLDWLGEHYSTFICTFSSMTFEEYVNIYKTKGYKII